MVVGTDVVGGVAVDGFVSSLVVLSACLEGDVVVVTATVIR